MEIGPDGERLAALVGDEADEELASTHQDLEPELVKGLR